MHNRIEIKPDRCHGKPVAHGTRTPVAVVLSSLAGGDNNESVAEDYGIRSDDVRECVDFKREELKRTQSDAVRSQ